jgi:hypothetical protein
MGSFFMVNRPHTFKHSDIVRIVKAARAAGVPVDQITVDPHSGAVTVGPGKPDAPGNDLDNWLRKQDADQS